MRRSLLCLLTSAVLLAITALPTRACLNDREVDNAEREFKSHYADPAEGQSPRLPPPSATDQLKYYGPLAMGGLLLVGAFAQVRRRPGARAGQTGTGPL
jgi:hypothetical protein